MHEKVELSGITKQIMPGPSGYLEKWQTLEVNVTLGFASGDIDPLGLPFLKVTLELRHYLYNITFIAEGKGINGALISGKGNCLVRNTLIGFEAIDCFYRNIGYICENRGKVNE